MVKNKYLIVIAGMGLMIVVLLIGQEDIKSKVYDLDEQVSQLSSDNAKLTEENTKLTQEIKTLKTNNSDLTDENQKLNDENNQYKETDKKKKETTKKSTAKTKSNKKVNYQEELSDKEKMENSLINYKMNVGPGIYNVSASGDFVPGTYQVNVLSGKGKISGPLGTYPFEAGEEDMMSFMLEDQVIVSGDLQLEVILKLKNDSGVKASDFKNN